MKAAVLLKDGRTEVILTPEVDIERVALKHLERQQILSALWGEVYEARGGYTRVVVGSELYGQSPSEGQSLVLRLGLREVAP